MPESLATRWGSTPISKQASMMRSEMALWPQPAQSVLLLPLYRAIYRPTRLVLADGAGGTVAVAMLVRCLLGNYFIGYRTRVKRRTVIVANAAELRNLLGAAFQPQQAKHLGVAVLIHDVDALVAVYKIMNFRCKRVSPQTAVAGIDIVIEPQLLQALFQCPVAGAVGDDAHFGFLRFHNDGAGNLEAGIFKLACQAVHIVHVNVRPLAVDGLFIVSAAARKPAAQPFRRSRQSAVANAVAIHVFVALEASHAAHIDRK